MQISPVTASSVIAALLPIGCAGPLGPAFGGGPDLVAGLCVVLFLGSLFYRLARTKSDEECQGSPAARIVRERYARGEITREEFQHRMRDLSTPTERIQ
jgi:Short C-terminal domain